MLLEGRRPEDNVWSDSLIKHLLANEIDRLQIKSCNGRTSLNIRNTAVWQLYGKFQLRRKPARKAVQSCAG